MNVCNGIAECPDNSDERGCDRGHSSPSPTVVCNTGYFPCDENRCFPLSAYCNGKQDCYDEFDESDCEKNNTRVYQVRVLWLSNYKFKYNYFFKSINPAHSLYIH
jgi:hypothetical protein